MDIYVKEYMSEADKEEIQKYVSDIVSGLCPMDRICISVERQSDYEEILKALIHEGAVI